MYEHARHCHRAFVGMHTDPNIDPFLLFLPHCSSTAFVGIDKTPTLTRTPLALPTSFSPPLNSLTAHPRPHCPSTASLPIHGLTAHPPPPHRPGPHTTRRRLDGEAAARLGYAVRLCRGDSDMPRRLGYAEAVGFKGRRRGCRAYIAAASVHLKLALCLGERAPEAGPLFRRAGT